MMIKVDSRRRCWAKPLSVSSFTTLKNSGDTFQGASGGPVICFICKVYLPRVLNDKKKEMMLEHRRSARHSHNLKIVRSNSICIDDSSNNVLLRCKICNRTLDDVEHVEDHILSRIHRDWLVEISNLCCTRTLLLTADVVSTSKFMACTSDFAFCNVCKKDIDCTALTIMMHTSEVTHRKQLLETLLPYTGIFPIENNTAMWCKVCDLRMGDHFEDVLVHICGNQEHGQWFHDVELRRLQDVSPIKYLTDIDETRVTCTRCDLEIKADSCSITAHVHSEPHRLRQRHSDFKIVKSLNDQNFWPTWSHWNYLDILPFGFDPDDDWLM